jgi:DNA repair photolyase
MQLKLVKVKSILNHSKLGGYTLNPYVGCSHGCVYCYNQHFIKIIGREERWGDFLEIKLNGPEILEKEITGKYKNLKNEVFFSTITDPYNFLEKQYQLTRQCLEILARYQWPVQILTKSDLVLKDLDIFKKFSDQIKIGFTITTLNLKAQMIIEPGASLVEKRFQALEKLKKIGIKTYAFVGPVLPYFTDLNKIFEVLKNKVDEIWFDTLNTKKENWLGLEKALKLNFPQFLPEYKRIFFQGRKNYEDQLKKRIKYLAKNSGMSIKICF